MIALALLVSLIYFLHPSLSLRSICGTLLCDIISSHGKRVTKHGDNEGILRDPGFVRSVSIFSGASTRGCVNLYVMGADCTSSVTTNQQSAASNCI